MYQMPYGGGGYPPYQQGSFPPQGGFPNGGFPPPGGPGFGVPPPGGFPPPGSPGFGAPAGGFPPASYGTTNDDDDEYEYITDDDGDYIEDEDGTILTIGEAQNRGLIEPAGEGERGIGKKLLIGGAVLGGIWILRKQLKKKKKVKKQKGNQSTVSYNKPQQNIYGQAPPQNIYGQPQHGYGQAPPPPQGIYGQPAQYPPFKRDVPGPGFGGPGFGGW